MTIYVICGPVGSKLSQFAMTLKKRWEKKKCGTLGLINETCFLEKTSESESFKLNTERMLQVIQQTTSDDLVIYGHHFFSNEQLRKILTTGNLRRDINNEELDDERICKLFLETDSDTLLANYIRDHVEYTDLDVLLKNYEAVIKPQNDDEILPSKKFADVVIPGYSENKNIYRLFYSSNKQNLKLIHESDELIKANDLDNKAHEEAARGCDNTDEKQSASSLSW